MESKEIVEADMDVYKLLSYIQKELKVPKLRKKSGAGANYKFRNAEDILEAVKKLLPDGAYLIVEDNIEVHGENEQQRFYVKASAELWLNGYTITATGVARETLEKLNKEGNSSMDAAQLTGAASSYARKYALNGLFCIDDTKDADEIDGKASEYTNLGKSLNYQTLLDLLAELRVPDDVINKWIAKEGVDYLYQFSSEQANRYIKFLESKRGQ